MTIRFGGPKHDDESLAISAYIVNVRPVIFSITVSLFTSATMVTLAKHSYRVSLCLFIYNFIQSRPLMSTPNTNICSVYAIGAGKVIGVDKKNY